LNRCSHAKIVLLPKEKNRLRCRHCHLTIKPDDLEAGYCPECFEKDGVKRDDFDEVKAEENGVARYRCELCGAIITAAPSDG
jgi:Zn finger protein HypA/HybF involved in hydrogenase expression